MLKCPEIPPLDQNLKCNDVYTKDFRASYLGRLTEIEYQKGVLRAMFGRSRLVLKTDTLPEWIKEGASVSVDFQNGAVKISPC